MSKVFRFVYDSEYDDNEPTEYPEATSVKIRHYFSEGTTWPVVLYQFCKFLESTGYVGIVEKVVLRDPFDFHKEAGFETIGSDQYIATVEEPLDNEDKDAN
jgi:hypothetical protein